MLHAFILNSDGTTSSSAETAMLRAALRTPGTRFWLDMEKPSDEEISLLDDVFGFHPLAIEDTITYSQRPKIESYNHLGDACKHGYFYMVFHGPDQETFREQLRTKEVDMFVSENYLVTVHDEPMQSVTDVRARAAVDPRLVLEPGVDMLLHSILDHLIDHYRPILDFLEVELDRLEEEALSNANSSFLTEIAQRKRDLLNFRRIIGPQRDVLALLTRGEVPFIRESTRVYMRDALDHLNRTVEMVELYRDLVTGARDIYLSSMSNNLNQIMKTLTILSVIALPMTVITSFFGMNFEHIPGLQSVAGFWIAVGVMLLIVSTLVFLFWKKKWI
jgi:magnesium transporter